MADLMLHVLDSRTVEGGNKKKGSQNKPCRQIPPDHERPNGFSISTIIRDASDLVLSLRDGLSLSEREHRRHVEERKTILAARMHNAPSMGDWEAAARELDHLEGNDQWKADPSTGDCNPEMIEVRLRELDEARTNCDIRAMVYLVRTALSRDMGGMGNVGLYRHSYIGTKHLIERYVDSAVKTVEALVEQSAYALPLGMEQRYLLEGLLHARQSFGRSALLLSGGGTFGMAHIGVLKAMFEAKLLPRIISGASAGSIVCSVLCTRTDEEVPELLRRFPYGDLAVFDDEGNPDRLADHIRRLLTEGSWSDISRLTRVMREMLGDITFQEAYNRTRRVCNICVSSPSIYELPRLLNYVTAPNVIIWSAVAASCSVPLVFNAASLLVKDPTTGAHIPWNPTPEKWIDGSVDNDLPMTRLSEMFNVNHFVVSQVNPHVVPFLAKDDYLDPNQKSRDAHQPQVAGDADDWLQTLASLAKDEALHRLHFLVELGIFPNLCTKLRSVLSQRYSGDITIIPEISPQDLPRILKNPSTEFMLRNCLVGEKATWPKLSRMRDRCAIELALDRAVHALRTRVVFSKSQVDLRRLVTGSNKIGLTIGEPDSRIAPLPLPPARKTIGGPSFAPVDDGEGTDDEPYRKRRRGSGSSIQLAARQRMLQNLNNALAGHGSEDHRDQALSIRRGGPGLHLGNRGAPGINGPKSTHVIRNSKSHHHLQPRHFGPFTGPLPAGREPRVEFDFSKPLTSSPLDSTSTVNVFRIQRGHPQSLKEADKTTNPALPDKAGETTEANVDGTCSHAGGEGEASKTNDTNTETASSREQPSSKSRTSRSNPRKDVRGHRDWVSESGGGGWQEEDTGLWD